MQPKDYQNALSMRKKIEEAGNEFHKEAGFEAETPNLFRLRVLENLSSKVSFEELEHSLPIRFHKYLIRDAQKQTERDAFSNFLLSHRIAASTQNLGRKVPNMPNGISEIAGVVRFFLEKTGRKELADEFERTMAIDPALEASNEQKKSRAIARGKMLAKISEEFKNETPENIEMPEENNDFKRLSPRFIFLQALSSCFSKSLDSFINSEEISFTDEDLKLCRHVSEFESLSERILKQSDFICSPYYKYFNIEALLQNMEYEDIHNQCKNAERMEEPFRTFTNDIDAAAYYLPFKNAKRNVLNTVKDINKNNDTLPDRIFKQVKDADPFYLFSGSNEYDDMKKSMKEYASLKVKLNPEDKNFEKDVEKLTEAANLLLKNTNRYLKNKGDLAKNKREAKRMEAAKAVRDFTRKQLESLKELKYFKSISSLERENANGYSNLSENALKDTDSAASSIEFYRRGKKFTSLHIKVSTDSTEIIQNGLNNVFNPSGEEENWFAALKLGNSNDFKKPYTGNEKRMAEDLISHMVAKAIIVRAQRKVYPDGNKDKPKTLKTASDRFYAKINAVAEGLSYDEFDKIIKMTTPLKKAFKEITPENVYNYVTEDNWYSLDSLTTRVMKNIPVLVAKHSDTKQRKPAKENSNKMKENTSKAKAL